LHFSKRYLFWAAMVVAVLFDLSLAISAQTIQLHVDLTDAPRNIYHAKLRIPVRPGDMSLVFPKWIPGNHRPSGPIGGLTGVQNGSRRSSDPVAA
jgi:hypothetical protein